MPPLPTDEAIFRTLLYADIFDYPLTPHEIHYYLIETTASREAVLARLADSPWLQARLAHSAGYVMLSDRQALSAVRQARRVASAALWPPARRWAAVLGALPFVRLVAVTGALAVDNSPAADDIDYFIITAPGRVWLARALAVGVVRLARLWRVGLCPNYVLAHSALAQRRRDLFVAHDLAQMVPLVGLGVYAELRAANPWVADFLPHAAHPLRTERDHHPRGLARTAQRLLEWLLGGPLGEALESWERRRKLARFAPAARQAHASAELDAEHVKGHFDDHGHPILQRFEARLRAHLPARDVVEAG
ncbi:MAG: hypothetical protein IT317_17950 [Anaerolineales bacterium]|nr:hypothetical protein [Anaerolineales bacterium]